MTDIVVPRVGVSVTEVTVVEWHVGNGEHVVEGDRIVTIATDKVDVDINAPATGILEQHAKEDENHPVGAVIGTLT